MTIDRVWRLLTLVVVLGLGAVSLARPDALLAGGITWLAFLFCVLSGWGWLVARLFRADDPDFGLRAVWGIAGYLAVTGVLVMFGICSRPVVLGLVVVGAGGFAWRELTTPAPIWELGRRGLQFVRDRPVVGWFVIVVGAAAVVHIAGAIARLDRSPWDDDIGYTPFVQRLLHAGNLVEPFSFRRLGAYGGQTVLQALGAARGTVSSIHVVDQGLCFGLVLMLIVGHARSLGRVAGLWLGVVVLIAVLLPDISINTASYWSGAVLFFGLYRTVVLAAGRPREGFALAALIGAATCTLRQSYLPVVALFLVLVLASRFRRTARDSTWREAWAVEKGTIRLALAVGAATLLPWCIAAFVSSRTFLFPFMEGTWNHGLSLGPPGWSWVDELSSIVNACIDAQPIVVMPVVVALLAFTDDTRSARPLSALFVASLVGFFLLAHSFAAADAFSLWRYAFGYALPLVLVFALEIGNEVDPNPVRLAPLGRWVLLAALLVQIAFSRTGIVKRYGFVFHDLREAAAIDRHGDPNARAEHARYQAMQAAIPDGASVAIMLDDPAFLDFRRNAIANLDTPGFASPGQQLPSFSGAEPMRAYLLDRGLRYVAFVRPERSRYFFRREFWVWRLFNDTPFFQAMSAYIIDTIDTFAELAGSSKVLYDVDGLVVLDLGEARGTVPELDPTLEPVRRDAFVRALAEGEGLHREWSLATRRDVVFADGMSNPTYADSDADPHWYELVPREPKPVRATPLRWLQRRAHVRLRGEVDMHLVMRGRVNLNSVYSRPRLDVSLDGDLLTSVAVGDDGAFVIDLVVPKARLDADGWSDLYVVFSTIGQPERDVKDLRIARLEEVMWEPR